MTYEQKQGVEAKLNHSTRPVCSNREWFTIQLRHRRESSMQLKLDISATLKHVNQHTQHLRDTLIIQIMAKPAGWWMEGNFQLRPRRNSPLQRELWWVCLWKLWEWWDSSVTKWLDRERGMKSREWWKTKLLLPPKHHVSGLHSSAIVSQRNKLLETRGHSRGDAIEFLWGFWKTSKQETSEGGRERGKRLRNTSPIEKIQCNMLPQRLSEWSYSAGSRFATEIEGGSLEKFNKEPWLTLIKGGEISFRILKRTLVFKAKLLRVVPILASTRFRW